MKKLFISLFVLGLLSIPANAATWVAADRVNTVGAQLLKKNKLPENTKFKVVDGIANNTDATVTNTIQVSSTDLSYAGNDNEVAAVVARELGYIINGRATKSKMRDFAKSAINNTFSEGNLITTVANSDYAANKASLSDNKDADITGADLMIQANYNPLASIVVLTKMPGSTMEIALGKPCNSERAMNIYDYLSYNYPSKVKAGYGCKEYKAFLTYADPIVKERTSNKKKLEKFNKEQEKNRAVRAKNLAQYKSTGLSGWDTSYQLLKAFTESSEK